MAKWRAPNGLHVYRKATALYWLNEAGLTRPWGCWFAAPQREVPGRNNIHNI